MKYSELMLLENNVVDYLVECYTMEAVNIDIVEEGRKPSNVSKEVNKLFKNKNDYMYTRVFDDSEKNIKRVSDKVESDKTKYEVSKLINKLSTLITGLGTGTALIGKLSDSKTATILGAAVTVSGLISKVCASKKTVEKNADKYDSSLRTLYTKLDVLKDNLDRADDDLINFQKERGLKHVTTKKELGRLCSRTDAIRQIERIQANINSASNKLNADQGIDFIYDN